MKNKKDFWSDFIPEVDWHYQVPQPIWFIIIDWVCATIFAVIAGVAIALTI